MNIPTIVGLICGGVFAMVTEGSIYQYMMEGIMDLLAEIDLLDRQTIKKRLATITDHAELMDAYLDYLSNNKKLESLGKPAQRLEDAFDPEAVPTIQFFVKHGPLWK